MADENAKNPSETDPNLEKVCQELDNLVLDYMTTLETILNKRALLENEMKAGFFLMSKARYSMGNKAVGQLQYDEENMRATRKVKYDSEFVLIDNEEDESSNKSELRQRKQGTKQDQDAMDELVQGIQDVKIQKKDYDPLKWFGVLVPQALRQSQGKFRISIEHLLDIANLQNELMEMKRKFKALQEQKRKIQQEASG